MKSIVIPAVLAVLLTAAGIVLWTMGKAEQRLADAHREMAMLQYANASDVSDATVAARPMVQRVAGFGGDEQLDARHLHATADYWQTRYAALEPKRDAGGTITETDPDVLMLAANASFRVSQADTDRAIAVRRLRQRREELRRGAQERGGAPRRRVQLTSTDSRARRDGQGEAGLGQSSRGAAARAAGEESDLPAGPTLHGRPGGPPAKSDMAQFKIVIPKRGEERKDDPQAGKGNVKVRKG